MAKKQVLYENNRLKGKLLDSKTCGILENLIKVSESKGYIDDLKKIIYDIPPSSIEMIKESKSNALVELEKGNLSNHQTIGVAYMYFAKRLVLGDSVGMGKTVETAGLCNLLESEYEKRGEEFRFLFLTEKTSVAEIRDKFIQFTGNYVDAVYGEKRFIQKFVKENSENINYSVVGSHSLITSVDFQQYLIDYNSDFGCCPFDLLVIDESGDILKNSKTQTYKSAEILRDRFERIILLNATPFESNLLQFYNQIHFIDKSFLPTKTDFSNEYEVKAFNPMRGYSEATGKYKNAEKFRSLVAYRYFARTRKSTGAIMEDCSADVIISDLSSVQKKLLKSVSMPAMVYDCPSYFNSAGYNIETNPETTPKLKDLINLVTLDLKDEGAILVYTIYKETQMAIYKYLSVLGISVAVMNGDTSLKERNDYINKFVLGDIKVLVTNVQKGLDFNNCNHCIFYDYDPSSSKMVQFEGRMEREHNIVGKHIYILVSRGSELKKFKTVLADKAKASDMFAGSDFSCIMELLLDDERLKQLV